MNGIMTGAALIFFAFLGFENIGNIGEETKNPRKTLPKALIYSIIISTILYVLVAIVAVSVVPWEQLAASDAPLADVAAATMGSTGGMLLAIIALAATASTVLGLFVAASRLIYGLAEEKTFPKIFLKITKHSGAPWIAILASAIVAIAFILPGDITTVAALTDWGALFIFMIVNFTVIWLRFKEPNATRGFKIPLNIGKVPVLPVFGMIFCGVMLFHFSKKVFVAGVVFFLVGLLLYSMFFERHHKELEHHQRKSKHIKHYAGHKPKKRSKN
ncbi:APC family permease [Nanoarchaeota archaeon]